MKTQHYRTPIGERYKIEDGVMHSLVAGKWLKNPSQKVEDDWVPTDVDGHVEGECKQCGGSKTPETDAALVYVHGQMTKYVREDFARRLETERDELLGALRKINGKNESVAFLNDLPDLADLIEELVPPILAKHANTNTNEE